MCMSELLTTSPQAIIVAVVLAVAIDLLRRLLRLVARGARWFWNGPAEGGETTTWYAELASYLLFPPLAFVAFVPPLVVIVATAVLMGFPPPVKLAMLAHGMALLWTLTAAFLWLQIWHLMGLPGFWRRVRYLLLLVALPLLMQILTWLLLEALLNYAAVSTAGLRLAAGIGHLFSLGVFPFLVPVVHARVLVPVFTFTTSQTARRWRPLVTGIGVIALAAFVVLVFLWFGETGSTSPFS
jgi:hypothetical protein